MAIKRTSTLPLLSPNFDFDKTIEDKLRYIGNAGVKYAIQNHVFNNQTYNLQDSYGYAIYRYGAIKGEPELKNPQATVPKKKNGEYIKGHDATVNFLRNYKASPEGWTLLVVAGMYYASFVEFYHKLDVLQNSEMYAENLANEIFREMKWIKIDQNYGWR